MKQAFVLVGLIACVTVVKINNDTHFIDSFVSTKTNEVAEKPMALQASENSGLPEPPVPRPVYNNEKRSYRNLASKTKVNKEENSVKRWFDDVTTNLETWFDKDAEDMEYDGEDPIIGGGDHDYNW